MTTVASLITSLTVVYSIVYSDAVTRKMFLRDDVIMPRSHNAILLRSELGPRGEIDFLTTVNFVSNTISLVASQKIELQNIPRNTCTAHFLQWFGYRSILLMDSPHKGPATRSFDISLDISINKPLHKQSSFRSFETPWCSFGVTVMGSLEAVALVVSHNSLGLMLFVCNWCDKKIKLILSYLISS